MRYLVLALPLAACSSGGDLDSADSTDTGVETDPVETSDTYVPQDTERPALLTAFVAECRVDLQCLAPTTIQVPSEYWPPWEDCADALVKVQRVSDGECFVSSACNFFSRDPAWLDSTQAECEPCNTRWPECP